MIIQTIRDFLADRMPHTLLPQAVFAKVTKGEGKKVNLRILDKFGQEDSRYEELPDIPTEFLYKEKDEVIISFIHGELERPIILRKVDQLPQVRFAIVKDVKDGTVDLQILSRDGTPDKGYEELKDMENDLPVEKGDKVIISFLYCELKRAVVIRKWEV